MIIIAAMLTCPARAESLSLTMDSLAASDWASPFLIFSDSLNLSDRSLSMTMNSLHLLKSVAIHEWDWLLFLEDDLIFNRFIEHNIRQWLPSVAGCPVATVYSMGEESRIDPMITGGSQAILIARHALTPILNNWHNFKTEMQDLRIYRTFGEPIPTHIPNLVQHRPEVSTWGGRKHQSSTFSLDYRSG